MGEDEQAISVHNDDWFFLSDIKNRLKYRKIADVLKEIIAFAKQAMKKGDFKFSKENE